MVRVSVVVGGVAAKEGREGRDVQEVLSLSYLKVCLHSTQVNKQHYLPVLERWYA